MKKDIREEILQQLLDSVNKTVEELVGSIGFTPSQYEEVREALLKGVPLYQIMGIADSVMDARYAVAYRCYTTGNFADAEKIFQWLCSYNTGSSTYWMGLGATRQALAEYDAAVDAYQYAAINSALEDPAPFYYSAMCFVKQKKGEEAKVALQTILTLADPKNPEHIPFIAKAKAALEGLK
ncbi:MAG: SycD/LcrH family type III secretion system chaperone [Desulfovibrio sp.]|nr:SycD/LcrH family type III secretion system chaperone [Desulfovibrio sp.]